MKLRILLLILAAGLALAVLPGALVAQSGSFHRSYQVNGPVLLVIHNGSGDVRVSAMPGNTVTVDASIRENGSFFWGPDPRVVQRIEDQPPIEQDGNSIRISLVDSGWTRHVSIRYTITVPPQTQVQAETGSGDIYLDSLQRDARLQTGSGDVHVNHHTGNVHAASGSGDISFGSISGSADFSTGSGDVRGRDVSGHLRASTGSGEVSVASVGQGAYANTGSGDVSLGQVSGDLTASTGSGEVSVGGQLDGSHRWDLGSGSGEIRVSLPASAFVRARLETGSGDIAVRFPQRDTNISRHSWSGTIGSQSGSPSALLIAHADSGGIVVAH
ncbi:MAG: DUF4097 family beta strand repeat-containing protein [Terriglobales bacterium]